MKARIEALLKSAGINVKKVLVLGKYVHVDSYSMHCDRLQHIFTAAGFVVIQAKDGMHLDGYNGYRIITKLAA